MRQLYIIFIFLLAQNLYSASSETKIIKLIFESILNKTEIFVLVDTKEKAQIVQEAGFDVATSCSRADIIYSTSLVTHCMDKPLFTDNYSLFKEKEEVIGAFYWNKGRPSIMFSATRMNRFGLNLPETLRKYEMKEIQ